MKPPPFAYRQAASVQEATQVLDHDGEAAAVLAGGQSLLIDLHFRRGNPRLVLDINPVRELADIAVADGYARIGALVRHRDLEDNRIGDPLGRLLGKTASYVAHPPIRARGTFAGSVAWAHPAAEWCAITAGLGGVIELASASGHRAVPAENWFAGRHVTTRRPQELVVAVRLPLLGPGAGTGFAEHRRTHGSFAMAAAFAAVRLAREGSCGERGAGPRITWARVGMANAAQVPVRARAAEDLLTGEEVTAELLDAVAESAAAAADPVAEPDCPAEYRRHVLSVLVRRSLEEAVRS